MEKAEKTKQSWRPPRRQQGSIKASSPSGAGALGDNQNQESQGGTKARQRLNTEGAATTVQADLGEPERKSAQEATQSTNRRTGKRGGRRRTAAKKRQIEIKDKNLRELLVTATKLLAMVAQQVRTLSAVPLRTALLPTKSPIVEAIREEAADYGENTANLVAALATAKKEIPEDDEQIEQIDQARKKVQAAQKALWAVGPPARCTFVAFVATLFTQPTTPPISKAVLGRALEQYDVAPPDVAVCKLASCRDEGMTK